MPRNPNCTKQGSGRKSGAPMDSATCFDIGDVEFGTDGKSYVVRQSGKTQRWVAVVGTPGVAKRATSRTNRSPEPQWNIFTGGQHEQVQKKLRRACKSGPIYVAVDLSLRKAGFGDDVTVLVICLNADTFPADLRLHINHLSRYNDHAWVVGTEQTGTYEGVAVWKLFVD